MENCPREGSFPEMYSLLGDSEAQAEVRAKNKQTNHCPWLKRDPFACESLPDGIDGAIAGTLCPHNVYAHNPEVFSNRQAVSDTLERLFRLVNSSQYGIVDAASLDIFSVTELIVSRNEIDRQQNERQKREYEKARLEAQVNQG